MKDSIKNKTGAKPSPFTKDEIMQMRFKHDVEYQPLTRINTTPNRQLSTLTPTLDGFILHIHPNSGIAEKLFAPAALYNDRVVKVLQVMELQSGMLLVELKYV